MSQYGWKYDVVKCTGCRACVVACKSENNTDPKKSPLVVRNDDVPKEVSYRWVVTKEISSEGEVPFFSQACNHCLNPACLASCPVGAISKDSDDGIVLIDQDKCIGCRYCEQACPYHAPRFNENTKKMEKCTFCYQRVRNGLKPACVSTCVGRALDYQSDATGPSGTPPDDFADTGLTNPVITFE
ncbi:MAG: 4Fe-4S dicluster domain-containing protein [Candidatus Schekmanbacteria bacterium]|nr:MAG: 4Fe-4S dicluster domain-containing protein [Candidatus Schekmanbacteria bacterium]